ncbi:MAG: heptosyltransferase, partial [Desulfovibrio sp.]|nr:heptosyltransferase [Desulfovibrio sp.]
MEHVLVLQAARFGDLLQTKRLILSLQKRAAVSLLIDQSLAPLARLIYPEVEVIGLTLHGRLDEQAQVANRQIFQTLSATHFDRIYNCNLTGLTAAICRLFEPEQVVGYRARPFFSGAKGFSQVERAPLLSCVFKMTARRRLACCNLEDVWAHLCPSPILAEEVNPLPKGGGRGLGVVVAGRQARRSLTPKLLADLLGIYARLGHDQQIFFFGTAEDKASAYQLRRNLPAKLNSLVVDL